MNRLDLLLDQILYDDTNLLLCGGAGGHMLHPYDKYKDPKDFLDFFRRFLTGEIEATEKVDGYNLFVGYNKKGKVVAARNKNQDPIENITDKFPLTHGAFAGFYAGWKALKSKFESLSVEERERYNLWDYGPKNFINLEILYGYIPNVVPYSHTTNYIVFHNFGGTPENGWEPQATKTEKTDLTALAKKLDSVAITSSEVVFSGTPGHVERTTEKIKSFWKFKGPIEFRKEEIKGQLERVAKEWQSYPEIQQLKKEKDATKQIELMRQITKKIGEEVLNTIVSKLSETGEKIVGHPGIEGLVLRQDGEPIKITGRFLDFSRPEDVPMFDATKDLREYIQKEILGLSTTTLTAVKDKTKSSVYQYVLNKRKKKFDYDLTDELSPETKKEVVKKISGEQKEIQKVVKDLEKKGRDYDLKSLLTQSYMLSEFKKRILEAKTYQNLVDAYSTVFYNIKKA